MYYFMETFIAVRVINILHRNWNMIDETHLDLLTCTSSPPTRVLVVVRTLLLSFLVNLPFSMSPSISHVPWWRIYTVGDKKKWCCVTLSFTGNVCLFWRSNTHCSFYIFNVAVIIRWSFSIASSFSFSCYGLALKWWNSTWTGLLLV